MPNYLRNYVPGGTCFFTLVTQDRRGVYPQDWGCGPPAEDVEGAEWD